MILPEFVFISSKELNFEFILETRAPHLVARVLRFETGKAKEDFIIKYNLLNAASMVPGYHIIICCYGTLEDVRETPVLGHHIAPNQLNILQKIKSFYETERIKGNESRLKKYSSK